MQYRRMGTSGLKLSALSFGSWVTFGTQIGRSTARDLIACAFDHGVNFFDNAELYARGESERMMGDVIADLRLPRDAYCVSSKVFFGAVDNPKPTQQGLSRKHVFDACNDALKRLRVDYLDLYFAHRPDPDCPIEETVLAMDALVRLGKVLYWGTSEWSAEQIAYACAFAKRERLSPPQVEQPQYNLLHRDRVEREYAPLYAQHGIGTTIWSPLASGFLTGKYRDGVPVDSRLAAPGYEWLQRSVLQSEARGLRENVLDALVALSNASGFSAAELALAWCLKNPQVSTVILGATKVAQLQTNLKVMARWDEMEALDFTAVLKASDALLLADRPA